MNPEFDHLSDRVTALHTEVSSLRAELGNAKELAECTLREARSQEQKFNFRMVALERYIEGVLRGLGK